MIKKVLYTFLPVCLLAIGFAGCEDEVVDSLAETVPLIVETSGKSFVMGETMTLTIKVSDVKNPQSAANEDFDVYLTAKDGETDVSKTAFKAFPTMLTFKKGISSLKIDLPITDNGIKPKQKLHVNVKAFVRGYIMTNSSQPVTISDRHYTIVSLKNNTDNIVNEGDEFTLQVQTPVPVTDDTDIHITVPDAQSGFYETLPTTLTVRTGEQTAEAIVKTKHNFNSTQNETLVLNFTTISDVYPLDNDHLKITMKDLEAEKGEKLFDERWVYDRPGAPFTSDKRQAIVLPKHPDAALIKELDPHPNADLAAKGWKFYNAWEFHAVGNTNDMWSNTNSFGNRVPMCLTPRNTIIAQSSAAVINDQFSNITDDGYLKMIEMKVPSKATSPASGAREYGTSAFYACGTNSPYKANSQLILEGCRMEVRARLRGEKKGFNMGFWLISSEAADQKTYSEVDILESPAKTSTINNAHQTFHTGPAATNKVNKTATKDIPNMKEWNIYWWEWRSDSEVALGINGEETVLYKSSEAGSNWTFTNAQNTFGLKFILTMGAPSKWALGGGTETGGVWSPDAGWDSGFSSFGNYEQDRNNDAIPRLEIDWVRTYINKPTIADYEQGKIRNTTKFY